MGRIWTVIPVLVVLHGCATLSHGTTQQISIATEPPGAICTLTRRGLSIATIDPTPGIALVERSESDLLATCSKPGYETGHRSLPSDVSVMTFGNALFGGVIGSFIDRTNGARYVYPDAVSLVLTPNPASAPP
jgi:hypothetical protein